MLSVNLVQCFYLFYRWSTGKISPYVWMPFGMGPRNCVGMRFAMEEMKLALAMLVKQFRFVPITETPVNYSFYFFLMLKPIWTYNFLIIIFKLLFL